MYLYNYIISEITYKTCINWVDSLLILHPVVGRQFVDGSKLWITWHVGCIKIVIFRRQSMHPNECGRIVNIVRAHGGRSGHLVLFLVALSFSKLQTFLNNIPEDNPLKSVYLTPKITFIFRPIWSHSKCISTNLSVESYNQEWRKLIFMTISYWYVYFLGSQLHNIGQYIEKSVRFRSWHIRTGVIITLICNQYYVIYQNYVHSFTYWILQSNSKIVLRYTQSRAKHVPHPLSDAQAWCDASRNEFHWLYNFRVS